MTKRVTFIVFWIVFAALFLVFLFPAFTYISAGFPEFMALNTTAKKTIFAIHIASGIIVYITAFFQFAPFVRNRNIGLHRKIGKVYVVAAFICIASLYYIISMAKKIGSPFWPSQYVATTLWLLFVLLALYFVRRGKIAWHRRFMTSGFICAAYFVTVRVVDRFCMDVFTALFKAEGTALLISDIFVWAFPLIVSWSYWLLFTQRSIKAQVEPNMP